MTITKIIIYFFVILFCTFPLLSEEERVLSIHGILVEIKKENLNGKEGIQSITIYSKAPVSNKPIRYQLDTYLIDPNELENFKIGDLMEIKIPAYAIMSNDGKDGIPLYSYSISKEKYEILLTLKKKVSPRKIGQLFKMGSFHFTEFYTENLQKKEEGKKYILHFLNSEDQKKFYSILERSRIVYSFQLFNPVSKIQENQN